MDDGRRREGTPQRRMKRWWSACCGCGPCLTASVVVPAVLHLPNVLLTFATKKKKNTGNFRNSTHFKENADYWALLAVRCAASCVRQLPFTHKQKLLGRLYSLEFGSRFPLEAVNNTSLQRNESIGFKNAFESLKIIILSYIRKFSSQWSQNHSSYP